jgi:Subtilase family
MPIASCGVEKYYDDQIVVALPDLNLVQQALTEFGVGFIPDRPHPILRLALLHDLANVDAAVKTLRERPDIGAELRKYEKTPGDRPTPVHSFDLLLKGLRLYFRETYPNWEGPRFGKNRLIDRFAGTPVIGPGGTGDPAPVIGPGGTGDPAPVIGPGGTGDPIPARAGLQARAAAAGALNWHPGTSEPVPGHGVLVGLLDGRISPNVWLAGGYTAHPEDVIEPRSEYNVNQGHCTSVASCILSRAPAAHIHLRTVLGDDGAGDVWTAAQKMAEFASSGCDVVNLSAGQCASDDGRPPLVLDTAVKLLSAHTVLVAAAGNQGDVSGKPGTPPGLTDSSVYYPAGCYDVIAVGALNQDQRVADFTPKLAPYISLMAPGVGVTVAYLNGKVVIQHGEVERDEDFYGWAKVNGTSYAAAIVTGEIAKRTIPGQVTAREALDQLLGSGDIEIASPAPGIIRPYRVGEDG